jgi:hypothetical protein
MSLDPPIQLGTDRQSPGIQGLKEIWTELCLADITNTERASSVARFAKGGHCEVYDFHRPSVVSLSFNELEF